jgi:hypothetical protein
MSKTTHYELNTPIGSEVLSVMTGLNPNFTAIDGVMYDNETRSTQALNKANVNEQNIATALGRITTAEGDIDTLESGLETANTNISGLTSRMSTAESGLVSANNRIQENTNQITQINANLPSKLSFLDFNNTRSLNLTGSAGDTVTYTATKNCILYGWNVESTLGKVYLQFSVNNNEIFSSQTTQSLTRCNIAPIILRAGDILSMKINDHNLDRGEFKVVPFL